MLSIMNEIDPCLLLPLCVLYEIQNQIYQQISDLMFIAKSIFTQKVCNYTIFADLHAFSMPFLSPDSFGKNISYSQYANVLIQLKKDMSFSNFFPRNLSCKSCACIFKQLIDSKKLLGQFLYKEMDLLQYLRSLSQQFPPILQRSKGFLRLCLVGV